jgi:hypothetical protein
MPSNYVLLNKQTLTANASSVVFSSIPQTGYTDLKIVMSARSTVGGGWQDASLTFNGSGTYSNKFLYGDAVAASSSGSASAFTLRGPNGNGATALTFGNSEIHIANYTSSVAKSMSAMEVTETNASTQNSAITHMVAGNFTGTSPITTVTITSDSGSFVTDSEFCLYGLAAVGVTPLTSPFATGGDSVTTDGTYWYHTFLSSGTFAPAKALTCDYLVVAGGGGGGSYGGGGGAGGLRSTVTATGGSGSLETPLSLSSGNYAVFVGAGGAGGTSSAAQGGSKKGDAGSNSIFATITSIGGGSGLGFNLNTSSIANGGSGGGGIDSAGSSQYINGGTGTSGQGFDGGRGYRTNSGYNGGGGGGGAGSAGSDGGGSGASPTGGAGGSGRSIAISGSSVTYASGGAGMAEIGSDAAGASGTANRGIGGGASTGNGANRAAGGNGGSGIVIIRYSIA